MFNEGEAVRVKSARKIAKVTFAVCPPAVPVTVMFRGLAVAAFIPLTVMVLLSPAAIVGGSNAQDAPEVHAKAIESTNELGAEALMVKVVVAVPIWTTVDRLLAEREKTGSPVPESKMRCGLPTASSVIDNVPERLPVLVGVKVMLKEQLSPTFSEEGKVPQVLTCEKSPLMLMSLSVREVFPVFVRITVCGWLVTSTVWEGKSNRVGVTVTAPTEEVIPTPVTLIW